MFVNLANLTKDGMESNVLASQDISKLTVSAGPVILIHIIIINNAFVIQDSSETEEIYAKNVTVHVEDVLDLKKTSAPYAQMSVILLQSEEMDVVFVLEIQHVLQDFINRKENVGLVHLIVLNASLNKFVKHASQVSKLTQWNTKRKLIRIVSKFVVMEKDFNSTVMMVILKMEMVAAANARSNKDGIVKEAQQLNLVHVFVTLLLDHSLL